MSTPKDPDLIAKERLLKQMQLNSIRQDKKLRHAEVKQAVDLFRLRGWKLSFFHVRDYDPSNLMATHAKGGRTILYVEKPGRNEWPGVSLQFSAACSPHDHYEKLVGNELCLSRFRHFLRSGVKELQEND